MASVLIVWQLNGWSVVCSLCDLVAACLFVVVVVFFFVFLLLFFLFFCSLVFFFCFFFWFFCSCFVLFVVLLLCLVDLITLSFLGLCMCDASHDLLAVCFVIICRLCSALWLTYVFYTILYKCNSYKEWRKRHRHIPWLNVPVADANGIFSTTPAEVFTARLAVTITGALEFRILTLMLSGIPGRKVSGATTTYELEYKRKCIVWNEGTKIILVGIQCH